MSWETTPTEWSTSGRHTSTAWDRQRDPRWSGPALVDLHDGKGTTWKKTPQGEYYPDCPCHKPAGIE